METFQTIGFVPVLTENLRQGDCFYSAIYRSLESRGLLGLVNSCLGIPIDTEENFIQSARNIVALKVINGEAMSIYESYMVNFAADIDTLKLQIQSAPQYLQDFMEPKIKAKETNPDLDFFTYDEFAKEMAKNIRIMGTWSGETEVRSFRNILSGCDIVVDVYVGVKPSGNLPKRVRTKHYIYLYNVGEYHWKHFQLTGVGTALTVKRDMTPGIINSSWRGGRKTRKIHPKKKIRTVKRKNKAKSRKY